MLCFLPPLPAPRPEPPARAPLPERAAEVVLLIFIVLNVFFVLAALVPPLVGSTANKSTPGGSRDAPAPCDPAAAPAHAVQRPDQQTFDARACRRM